MNRLLLPLAAVCGCAAASRGPDAGGATTTTTGTTTATATATSGTSGTGTSSTSGTGTATTSGTTSSGGCTIDGGSFAVNAANPADDCQVCLTVTGVTNQWSDIADGTSCNADGGNVCQSGVCTTACVIGGTILAPGTISSTNPCNVCNPAVSLSTYANVPDLSLCNINGGNYCVSGTCQSGCDIQGSFVPQWTFSDPLQSQCCNPEFHPTAWTNAFGAAQPVSLGATPTDLAVADFNHDGFSDFAVTTTNPSVEVFVSLSDGGFVIFQSTSLFGSLVSLAAADFNSDGNTDLAILSESGTPAVFLLYGDGGGTFEDGGIVGTLPGPTGLAVLGAETDAPDLAVVSLNSGTPKVDVLPNTSGAFGIGSTYSTGTGPTAIVAGTFEGGTTYDLAIASGAGGGISTLLSAGPNNFNAGTPIVDAANLACIDSVQLTASGFSDLIAAGPQVGDAGAVQEFLSNGDGTFTQGPAALVGPAPSSLATFKRPSGQVEIAVGDSSVGPVDVLVSLDGGLSLSASYPAGQKANALATGDFNGDGLADLAVSDPGGTVYILYGQCR